MIRGDDGKSGSNKFIFEFGAKDFKNKNGIFLKMYLIDKKDERVIYITENQKIYKKNTVEWKIFYLPLSKFHDEDSLLKFEVFEYNKSFLGEISINLKHLCESIGKSFSCLKKNHEIAGQLKIKQAQKVAHYSFLDYILSGTEISLITAIDFSNSNLEKNDPNSLHYYDENSYIYNSIITNFIFFN